MTATVSTNSPEPASSQMLKMLNAFLTVQALHVAAALGLADRLAAGPRRADEVAGEAGADPVSLYRLMRMLTGLGVLSEEADGQFALAPLGATLRSDVADSVRDWALFVGAPEMWDVWAGLHGSLMTGEAAFRRVHSAAMWDYMVEHPHLGGAFNRWMTRQSDQHNAALVAAYDFSAFRLLADIGGGQGSTLAAILLANPSLSGILLDLVASSRSFDIAQGPLGSSRAKSPANSHHHPRYSSAHSDAFSPIDSAGRRRRGPPTGEPAPGSCPPPSEPRPTGRPVSTWRR